MGIRGYRNEDWKSESGLVSGPGLYWKGGKESTNRIVECHHGETLRLQSPRSSHELFKDYSQLHDSLSEGNLFPFFIESRAES